MMTRAEIAKKYLISPKIGIELGALHVPTPVLPGVTVTYVDRDPEEVARDHSDVTPAVKNWVVDDAEELKSFSLGSQDFIMAHHVLEHLMDPIEALKTWLDVLAPGGVLIFSIPDKNACFDAGRPETPFAHILADYHKPDYTRDFEHYIDWFMNSQFERRDPAVAIEMAWHAYEANKNIHFHCWSTEGAIDMVTKLKHILSFEFVEHVRNGGENIFVLRKPSA